MRPTREHATNTGHTYMVSATTWGRRALFRAEPWAKLMIETVYHYRGTAYLLHEFVVMPDHLHILFTPLTSLEKAVQFIKGGFSYRAKKELGSNLEIWQRGFSDHRIRDAEDYKLHVIYVRENPVKKGLCEKAEDYPYSSAHAGFDLDSLPQGLKPQILAAAVGAPEGAPFQSKIGDGAVQSKMGDGASQINKKTLGERAGDSPSHAGFDSDGVPRGLKPQILAAVAGAPEGAPFQSKIGDGAFQSRIADYEAGAKLVQAKSNKTA